MFWTCIYFAVFSTIFQNLQKKQTNILSYCVFDQFLLTVLTRTLMMQMRNGTTFKT